MALAKNLLVESAVINGDHIRFNLDFKHKLTLVLGESATGKSCLYDAMTNHDEIAENVPVFCVNGYNANTVDLNTFFFNKSGAFFVIDNADIIIPPELGFRISADKQNQYLVFCHSYGGFKPAANSLAELRIKDGVGRLYYSWG